MLVAGAVVLVIDAAGIFDGQRFIRAGSSDRRCAHRRRWSAPQADDGALANLHAVVDCSVRAQDLKSVASGNRDAMLVDPIDLHSARGIGDAMRVARREFNHDDPANTPGQ